MLTKIIFLESMILGLSNAVSDVPVSLLVIEISATEKKNRVLTRTFPRSEIYNKAKNDCWNESCWYGVTGMQAGAP